MLDVFPHEFQSNARDCGPASIKILAKYYGKVYTLSYLREICQITNQGVSLHDIANACEIIGLKTISLKMSFEDLKINVPLPCIIHWNRSHFVVLYKITQGHVFVSDPAKGLAKYSHQEFKKSWLGQEIKWAVIAVEPIAGFRQEDTVE